MSKEFDRGGADMGQRMLKDLITENWRDIYVGTRRVIPFGNVAQFPNTAVRGMDLSFSIDYITVRYGEEHYTISFEIDKKTLKPKNFLFSTNWANRPALLIGTHKTFLNHLLSLTRIGAV